MWKSVQIGKDLAARHERRAARPAEIKACSGCAGDYENPDRTVWSDGDEKEVDDAIGPLKEEFPVQEKNSTGEEEER